MKKILAFILATFMVGSVIVPTNLFAEDENIDGSIEINNKETLENISNLDSPSKKYEYDSFYVNDGFKYVIEGKVATIIGYEDKNVSSIKIPSYLDGHEVDSIADFAFSELPLLSDVYIPNTIVDIGQFAFERCPKLKNVSFEEGGLSLYINNGAFASCKSLEEINIPKRVITIGMQLFYNCESLKKVVLTRSIDNIGEDAFDGCSLELVVYVDKYSYAEDYCIANNIKYEHNPYFEITSIKLSAKSKQVPIGKSLQLKATIKPNNASNKKFKWKSSNKNIATVSSNGKVSAKQVGYVTITATPTDWSTASATIRIRVIRQVKSIKVKKTRSVVAGNTCKLNATVLPKNATIKKLKYKSSNKKVATVNSKGLVKAKKPGKAVITISATDGSKKKAKVTIRVKKVVPAKVPHVTVKKYYYSPNNIVILIDKTKNADKYQIYRSVNGGKYKYMWTERDYGNEDIIYSIDGTVDTEKNSYRYKVRGVKGKYKGKYCTNYSYITTYEYFRP